MHIVLQYVYPNPNKEQLQLILDCKSQLQKMERDKKNRGCDSKKVKLYQAVDKLINDAVDVIKASKAKDYSEVAHSGLLLISNIASLTDPVASALVGAICTVLSTIFCAFWPWEENIASQIRKKIKAELQCFRFDLLRDRGAGLNGIGEMMLTELQGYHSEFVQQGKCEYPGFKPHDFDAVVGYMNELKDIADQQFSFLAEENGSTSKEEREDYAKHCLTCLVGYSNVGSLYIMLLSWHKILSSATGNPVGLIDRKLEEVKAEAKSFLAFLSDRKMLGPAGWWMGKLRVMLEYRKKLIYLVPIERLHQLLELPLTTYTAIVAINAFERCLADASGNARSCLEPRFSNADAGDHHFNRGDNHYFCLVNNTRWTVCIFSGLIATKVNNLQFTAQVKPGDKHVHPCADVSKSTYFSSAVSLQLVSHSSH